MHLRPDENGCVRGCSGLHAQFLRLVAGSGPARPDPHLPRRCPGGHGAVPQSHHCAHPALRALLEQSRYLDRPRRADSSRGGRILHRRLPGGDHHVRRGGTDRQFYGKCPGYRTGHHRFHGSRPRPGLQHSRLPAEPLKDHHGSWYAHHPQCKTVFQERSPRHEDADGPPLPRHRWGWRQRDGQRTTTRGLR